MNQQDFELRRLGLRQMVGEPSLIDLYGAEFDDLMAELRADPDEDRRKAHEDRIKQDARHQIAYLATLFYQGIAAGEDRDEGQEQHETM